MGFSRQTYWSGLLFPSPGDLPNPATEPGSPALQTDSLPPEPPGKPNNYIFTKQQEQKHTEQTLTESKGEIDNSTIVNRFQYSIFNSVQPKRIKIYAHIKICTQMFIAALFIIAKRWKQSSDWNETIQLMNG